MKGRDMERLQEKYLKERKILLENYQKGMNDVFKAWGNKLCEELLKEFKNDKKKDI